MYDIFTHVYCSGVNFLTTLTPGVIDEIEAKKYLFGNKTLKG